jgi:hypothetical protein
MDKDSPVSVQTNSFGVPITTAPQSTIPGMLPMQQELHHNSKLVPRKRSVMSRILIIFFSVILLVPGAFFMYVAYLALLETGRDATIIPTVLGLIFLGGGVLGIISGMRR